MNSREIMSIRNDDVFQDSLDEEFRQLLFIIKPYIHQINDYRHLEKYRVWLERLSEVTPAEKFERNKYLVELANQIHDNTLKPPFTSNPPRGLLPRFRTYQKVETEEWPHISIRSEKIVVETPSKCKENLPRRKKNKIGVTHPPFQKLGNSEIEAKVSENSSWYDLSESSTTSINPASGDAEQDDDKNKLGFQHNKEGLTIHEIYMRKYKEEMKESPELVKKEENYTTPDEGEKPKFKPTQAEVEALKMRVKDLLEVKNALQDTHCITEDRKKTMDNLHIKLVNMEKKNEELKNIVETQKKKLTELEKNKLKELASYREKFIQLREKELDLIKGNYRNEIDNVRKSFETKIEEMRREHEKLIDNLKNEYETRIKKITEEKNEEILTLQNESKLKAENEGDGEHVIQLKKCISKLDKAMHKNEKDYVKKIEKLKQELEVKDMTTQVQLQTQKADLLVRNTVMKQEELKNALNNLEVKYKKMMETLQQHALESKKHDEKIIQDLKAILEKNKIQYSLSFY